MEYDEVHIREHRLPGIGRRFDIDTPGELVLSVIAYRNGDRELTLRQEVADEPHERLLLSRDRAAALASVLQASRFSIDTGDDGASVDVTTVVVRESSPAVGRLPAEVPLPAGFDAAVLAVVRDDTPELLEGDPERRCRPGDRLVVAARPDKLAELVAQLGG